MDSYSKQITLIKSYYILTKPGIVYGNAIAAIAGFFFAAKGHINIGLFLAMLIGTCLVIASSCVFNNYLDKEIDAKMDRTKNRPLVNGSISTFNSLLYATVLGITGFAILFFYTNIVTTIVGAIGMFFYVIVYGFAKRKSIYGTIVGSIPGATPPVAGYTAVTGHIDIAAILLFLILVFWQMPHFYAIAIYRLQDYAKANIPVWPVKKGIHNTKLQIVFFISLYILALCLLTFFGHANYLYLLITLSLAAYWLYLALQGFRTKDTNKWARKVFGFSLLNMITFSLMISISGFMN